MPGILLLIAVGVLGKYAQICWTAPAKHHHRTVPDIEYVLWAILFGLLITKTVGLHRIFRPGVLTYQFWLMVGIVALGSRFVLGDIAELGATSLVPILVDMTVAGTARIRAFGQAGLAAGDGHSICGGVRHRGRQGRDRGCATRTSATRSRRSWRWARWGCSR